MPLTFGARFRAVRQRLRLSQIEVAERLKVHPKTVGSWERGKDIPSFYTGCRAALALDTSPFFLSGLSDIQRRGLQPSNDERELLDLYRALPSDEAKRVWRESLRDAASVERISRKAKAA